MDEFSQLDPVYAAWFYFRMGEYDSGTGPTDVNNGPYDRSCVRQPVDPKLRC